MKYTDIPDNTMAAEPSIHPTAFIARGAQIIGDVRLTIDASVWFNSVLRGDINYIAIGERSNIQDGALLHVENDQPCIIANDVTVGHGAILHGCLIEEGCLIGMGANILSGAVVKRGSIVAAGSLVKENQVVEPFSLMAGVPSRRVRTLGAEMLQINLKRVQKYVKLAEIHREKGFSVESVLPT